MGNVFHLSIAIDLYIFRCILGKAVLKYFIQLPDILENKCIYFLNKFTYNNNNKKN